MPENKKAGPKGPYFNGREHFSYNNDLVHHPHQYKAHETVQDMVKKAEQAMNDNQFNG